MSANLAFVFRFESLLALFGLGLFGLEWNGMEQNWNDKFWDWNARYVRIHISYPFPFINYVHRKKREKFLRRRMPSVVEFLIYLIT